jgi:hypothetical protein
MPVAQVVTGCSTVSELVSFYANMQGQLLIRGVRGSLLRAINNTYRDIMKVHIKASNQFWLFN